MHVSRAMLWQVGVVLALAVLPVIVQAPFYVNMAILICIYITLGHAWNILAGLAGQVSLGQHVFFGIGAYTTTLLYVTFDISPWIGIPAGAVLSIAVAMALGWPTFKLRAHYFSIGTLLLGAIAAALTVNAYWAGGATGIYIPFHEPSLAAFQFSSKIPYYFIALGLAIVSTAVVVTITRRSLGLYLRSIRDDPAAAEMLGVNVEKYKLVALAWHAALTAVAGGYMAEYVLFIDPAYAFNLQTTILTILAVVIGGIGTIAGPIVGVAIMIPLSELTRAYLGGSADGLSQVAFGFLAVLLGVTQPAGLLEFARRSRLRVLRQT
jgi:branched-chain amino acid transport system permease protein